MTSDQKALRACADYARLNAEIRLLTKSISDALHYCKGVHGTCGIGDGGMKYGDHDDPTHLSEAFRPDVEDDGWGAGQQVWMTDVEIREYLYENCACCLKAYEFVLERKAAKKALGAAKRAITMIGRKAF
jgi:hypothetical protein